MATDPQDPPDDGLTAQHRWAGLLQAWRIPDAILEQAPRSPWEQPVDQFTVSEQIPDSPSHRRAREALSVVGDSGVDGAGAPSVLDIGCGGGRAAFALVPPAAVVTGVDANADMLAAFAQAAQVRAVAHQEILGSWPDVADQAPVVDVVVAHHVVYNVADLAAFAGAASAHARRRVVLELPERHPLSPLAPLWKHFWDLDRPTGPTAQDALAVLVEAGLPAVMQMWTEEGDTAPGRAEMSAQRRVEVTRTRLCLPADRDQEVAAVLRELAPVTTRRVATVWWDV
jgi:SAM-dependent methyltransferase